MTQGLVALAVVILLAIRQLKERKLKVSRMWIMPALMVYASFQLIGHDLIASSYAPLAMLGGLLIGALLGIVRGQMVKLRINPATGEVTSKGSITGLIIFIAVLAIRLLTKEMSGGAQLLSGALLMVSSGSIVFSRVWIYLAYKKVARFGSR